jgi:hypothetical protein
MRCSRRVAASLLVLLFPAAVLACIWDSETLKQERARFPSTLELITGKFLRHSKEFYEWRIKDRQEKLESDPKNVAYYDDIAVGYQKIGQHEKAIETILAKEEIQPGLYETYSNLGTFHILAGDFEKGLPYIDKALAINPDAHFGREKYQKWLVEYALTRMNNGRLTFPMQPVDAEGKYQSLGDDFSEFLATKLGVSELSEQQVAKAIQAILGMMRFANHDNPLLLEALGDLLVTQRPFDAARNLAARAYLHASYVSADPNSKEAYRLLARGSLATQTSSAFSHDSIPFSDIEANFKKELQDADQWYAALKERELEWIRQGKDVETNFDRLYAADPVALATTHTLVERVAGSEGNVIIAALILIVGVTVTVVYWRRARRMRRLVVAEFGDRDNSLSPPQAKG